MLAYMRRSSLGRVSPDDAWIQSTEADVDAFGVLQRRFEHVNDFPEVFRKHPRLASDAPRPTADRASAASNGTGFGLTSMRQRIRGVGGHVEVQSAPGEGTSVSARVPAITPAGAATKGETDR
ncbi:ATP-binding protein [Micromonospora tulbaghiae]|uniref:ATP-binding protein n=1 Tax=Micromonospora tulbaghiae TaxID=479978 RepID=UPI003B008B3E